MHFACYSYWKLGTAGNLLVTTFTDKMIYVCQNCKEKINKQVSSNILLPGWGTLVVPSLCPLVWNARNLVELFLPGLWKWPHSARMLGILQSYCQSISMSSFPFHMRMWVTACTVVLANSTVFLSNFSALYQIKHDSDPERFLAP